MEGPFKLFVYTIATMALLAVFFIYILPLFFNEPNPNSVISKSLDSAEILLGKAITNTIKISPSKFSKIGFDSDNRSVAFECNSSTLCCNKNEKDEN